MFVEKTFVPSWTWRSCRNGWTFNPISWKITCLCDPLFYWYQRTCLNLFESRLLYWPNRYYIVLTSFFFFFFNIVITPEGYFDFTSFFLNFSGYLWKDKSENGVRKILQDNIIPLDRLLVETDAPFMYPNTRASKLPQHIKDAMTER